jgi:periodic tryptophan protein 2
MVTLDILKQQGHYYDIASIAYSSDGSLLATGGEDGKLKLWQTRSGFCFVTFSEEHTGSITDLKFIPPKKQHGGAVILSASLDGSVRAFDLVKYRNFRVMSAPTPVQFTSLGVDSQGDVSRM